MTFSVGSSVGKDFVLLSVVFFSHVKSKMNCELDHFQSKLFFNAANVLYSFRMKTVVEPYVVVIHSLLRKYHYRINPTFFPVYVHVNGNQIF